MTRIFVITGDTFTSREELKAMGGRWVPQLRAWFVLEDQRDGVERLRALIGFSVTLVSLPGRRPASGRRLPNGPAQSSVNSTGYRPETRPLAWPPRPAGPRGLAAE